MKIFQLASIDYLFELNSKYMETGKDTVRKPNFSIFAVIFLFGAISVTGTRGYPAAGRGTLWVPDDYATIQDAIDAAVDGDTIIVRPGTYIENIDFLGRAITVMSEQGPEVTVIDGNHAGSVVTFQNGEGLSSVFEGFTTRNGSAIYGGGITCKNSSSPTIYNNTITENSGGGLFCKDNSSPMIDNNTITGNSVTGTYSDGAGINVYLYSCPTITNNTITENSADRFGGGIYCNYYSSPEIDANTIVGNSAAEGGGIFCLNSSSPIITNNLIKNSATGGPGGGIYCEFQSNPTISNNTLVGNYAASNGGGLWCEESSPAVTNCIFWDNSPDAIYVDSGNPSVTYSDVEGGWGGTGDIDEDPLFFDPSHGDFHLRQHPCPYGVINPCVDAGDPGSQPILGSTRIDGVQDSSIIDMGFHYPLFEPGENVPPVANFNWTPEDPAPNEPISFDASNSYDLDGTVVSYEWDWNDDGIFDESHAVPTAAHSWESADSYPVTLRVTDDSSAVGTLRLTVDVFYYRTIYVPDDFPTIQRAIGYATDRDTIIVRPGTYVENINFLGKAIKVMSEQGPEVTVIDGNQAGNVVTFESGEGPSSILERFTVKNGSAESGGGIRCDYSSPTISNNIITANGADDVGGGIYCHYSSPTITNNTIEGNSAISGGYGGGIGLRYSSSTISNNTIVDNSASYHGGGIEYSHSDLLITNNVITGNYATYDGGGIRSSYSDGTIANNLIWGNSAGRDGAGICSYVSSNPDIYNNTITGNSAGSLGGGLYSYENSHPTISNCILWGNSSDEIAGSNPVVTYSDIEGGWEGQGNIDADPLFLSFSGYDYLLGRGSPCIDTGDPAIEDGLHWPDWYLNGPRSDMGTYGGPGNIGWLP